MAKYRVSVVKALQAVVPRYLEHRSTELPEFSTFLSAGDMDSLRKLGHKLAGSGGGYGFKRLSEFGKQIEDLAAPGDAAALASCLAELKDYLENLEVVYE